ncbi:MAG: response regulator transcription factor [Rhizomicrobium sp.]
MPEPAQGQNRPRIFLVDDHPALRQGLALLLTQDGLQICGEAQNRAETLARLDGAKPDIVLLDISLGEESGLDLIEDIRARDAKVLCYSMLEDSATIKNAFDAGAAGYVTKRDMADSLLLAVRDVLAGNRHTSPGATHGLSAGTPEDQTGRALSRREKQIIALVGKGVSNIEIATSLNISVRTMEAYCTRIMDKLDIHGMREFRQYAIRNS